MATQKEKSPTKVITGKVRLSYVHLFEPYGDGDDKKFSVVALIPKTDKATIRDILAAQKAALADGMQKQKFGSLTTAEKRAIAAETIPDSFTNTLRDGDEEADLERNPEYAGHMFMNVSARTKPGIVDRALEPIVDSTEVYSGCYARLSINAFPFNTQGNKGISFGLNHVQKVADGDFLGGRSRAEDDFDELEDEDEDEDSLI